MSRNRSTRTGPHVQAQLRPMRPHALSCALARRVEFCAAADTPKKKCIGKSTLWYESRKECDAVTAWAAEIGDYPMEKDMEALTYLGMRTF